MHPSELGNKGLYYWGIFRLYFQVTTDLVFFVFVNRGNCIFYKVTYSSSAILGLIFSSSLNAKQLEVRKQHRGELIGNFLAYTSEKKPDDARKLAV